MNKQLSIPATEQPHVKIINGKAITTSLDVAKFFDKRHDNTARDIQKLAKDEPEFHALNFEEMQYIVEIGNGATRTETAYQMTRDGFTFLVMGYTGEKARKFKIAYINKFNEMEAALHGQPVSDANQLLQKPQQLDVPSTVKDRRPITGLLNTWVKFAPIDYRSARIMLNVYLGVESAEQIMLSQIEPAKAWLQEQINLAMYPPPEPALTPHKLSDEYKANEKELTDLYEQLGQSAVMEIIDLKNPGSTLSLIFDMKSYFKDTLKVAVNYEKILVSLQKFEVDYMKFNLFKKMLAERK